MNTQPSPESTTQPATHTPGPWTLETHHRQGHDRVVPVWYVSSANKVGVAVQPSFSSSEHEQANARLIAAAPSLLSALTELLEATDIEARDLPTHEYEEIVADARSRARKAIRQAQGT